MLTRKLRKAFVEVEKLSSYLEKNEWWDAEQLTRNFKRENARIEQIVQGAIINTIRELEMYEEEAMLWASNRMTNFNREPINISKAEQNKAKTQLKRIQKTIATLKEMAEGGVD